MKAHVSSEKAEKLRKDLKRETRLIKRKKRLERKTSRKMRKERNLKRRAKRENGETATEISEVASSVFEESSVTDLETPRENKETTEPELPHDSLPAHMLQQQIAADSSADALGVTSEPVLGGALHAFQEGANSSPKLKSHLSPRVNGTEVVTQNPLQNFAERSRSQPVAEKKTPSFVVSPSYPELGQPENQNRIGVVDALEEIDDIPVFNSRVPKRKRVKEKSLLHIHSIVQTDFPDL